jgi:hypothetical protein
MVSGFTGPPKVEQIDLATVRVSWEGLVTQRECADQFLVKYWQRTNPQSYLTQIWYVKPNNLFHDRNDFFF